MENKIQVEEYIRTYDGIIGKILEDEDIGENGVCIDTTFLDDYADETNFVKYKDIKSHSFNIIDLIEMGDILKYRLNNFSSIDVSEVIRITEGRTLKEYLSVKGYSLNQIEILSLITKEQFKNIEYEV